MRFCIGLFAAGALAALPGLAGARTIGGIEISGTAKHGSEFPLLEYYHDNVLLGGAAVNAFGVLAGGPLAAIGFAGPASFHTAAPGHSSGWNAACAFSVGLPHLDADAAPLLVQSYGKFWYDNRTSYDGDDDCRMGLELDLGAWQLGIPALTAGYDDGIGDILFAGTGTLSGVPESNAASVILSTSFDEASAGYEILVRVTNSGSGPSPSPVPLPAAGSGLSLALGGLSLWRRLTRS